jgi:hypothetical protein
VVAPRNKVNKVQIKQKVAAGKAFSDDLTATQNRSATFCHQRS